MLGVEEAKHESITKGDWDELRLMEDQEGELSVEQRLVRSATGALGWLADIYLDAKPFAHKLQRVSRATANCARGAQEGRGEPAV